MGAFLVVVVVGLAGGVKVRGEVKGEKGPGVRWRRRVRCDWICGFHSGRHRPGDAAAAAVDAAVALGGSGGVGSKLVGWG